MTALKIKSRIAMIMLAFVMIAVSALPAFADGVINGWAKTGTAETGGKVKWCYFNAAGQYVTSVSSRTKNKWVNADGKRFYFNKKRMPVGQGFCLIKKKLYYFGPDGSLVYGTFYVNGEEIATTPAGNITGLPYYRYRYKKFVIIDLSDQQLEFYKKGMLMRRCPVVTGNPGKGWNTPTGQFKVRHKSRNTTLRNGKEEAHVTYWMAFIRNEYGMHDASWRRAKDYRTNRTYRRRGSHGCVNMRKSDAAYLYRQVRVGTPVIVQD